MPAPHRDPARPCPCVEWPLTGSPAPSVPAGSHRNADFDLSRNANCSLAAALLPPPTPLARPAPPPRIGDRDRQPWGPTALQEGVVLTQTPRVSHPTCFLIVGSPAWAGRLQGALPARAWHTWASHTALAAARDIPGRAPCRGLHPAPGYLALLTPWDGHGAKHQGQAVPDEPVGAHPAAVPARPGGGRWVWPPLPAQPCSSDGCEEPPARHGG